MILVTTYNDNNLTSIFHALKYQYYNQNITYSSVESRTRTMEPRGFKYRNHIIL